MNLALYQKDALIVSQMMNVLFVNKDIIFWEEYVKNVVKVVLYVLMKINVNIV